MTSDLVSFINARLDEDEHTASAIERKYWDRHDTWVEAGGHCATVLSRNPADQWDIAPVAWLPTFQSVGWDVPGPWASSIHIARHDPARVLREVAAKRRILRGHPHITLGDKYLCDRCHPTRPTHTWCDHLRALAAIWSDHPDFQQEWSQ